ncbi:uncharacterized protein M6B38_154505 [Iris pallida]|uniref:RING-type domain-containing protein n=1 Tax=Iris pallida TaxID=29817 RepID=A0AAX6F5I5_IRIPA|nr:uncharacterized protein M6B38_154505 [Iris pallida]
MGASCCVAVRNNPSPLRISCDVSNLMNVRHSPSWSFRWDNRTHIEDIMDNTSRFPHQNSANVSSEIKSTTNTETEGLSDGGSSDDAFHIPKWRKSPSKVGIAGSSKLIAADLSNGGNSPPEEKCYIESPAAANDSDMKPPISIPYTPSSSSCKAAGPSTSQSCSLLSDPTSSRKAGRSPGYQLSRQISDSRIPSLKTLNESGSCSPEGSQSFVLSVCSNDISAGGSQGGSSDGWSMRTFSELVAASIQRDRWSFDSENVSSVNGKFPRSPPSADIHICRVCSKLLKEKSPWSVEKIVSSNEISVAAVLICGHVYHAECLESITSEVDRYDPPCPVCTNGENLAPKLLGKAELKAKNKISRRAVADNDVDGNPVFDHHKAGGKCPRMGASSSMKASFTRPFLKRQFSFGSRPPPTRSVSETEATRKKKGFWARYRRD